MPKVGIIGGDAILEIFRELESQKIETEYGSVESFVDENLVVIPRHGREIKKPPHKINHRANMKAFKDLSVESIISITSVGSLRRELEPPSILIPHDYINLWSIATFFDSDLIHITPELSKELRESVIKIFRMEGIDVIENGIYIQTLGPRLETKAEVRFLKQLADVVGMTMASEATLANELDIEYADISTVDNYAHGIIDEPLRYDKILENSKMNMERIRKPLLKIVEELC